MLILPRNPLFFTHDECTLGSLDAPPGQTQRDNRPMWGGSRDKHLPNPLCCTTRTTPTHMRAAPRSRAGRLGHAMREFLTMGLVLQGTGSCTEARWSCQGGHGRRRAEQEVGELMWQDTAQQRRTTRGGVQRSTSETRRGVEGLLVGANTLGRAHGNWCGEARFEGHGSWTVLRTTLCAHLHLCGREMPKGFFRALQPFCRAAARCRCASSYAASCAGQVGGSEDGAFGRVGSGERQPAPCSTNRCDIARRSSRRARGCARSPREAPIEHWRHSPPRSFAN